MEAVKILAIHDLLQRSRPLTATFSLHSGPSAGPSSRPIPRPSPLQNHPPTTGGPTNQNPNPKILTPLNHPAILIGTVTLPSHNNPSTPTLNSRCSNRNCFAFSDGSSTICCDILDFDVRLVGKKIHVLSWNFIPFKRGRGGFLEIIKWCFPESNGVLNRCSNVDSFPLVSFSSSACNDSKARYWVHGALELISPVSLVPCTTGINTSQSNARSDTSGSRNIRGFLVQIMGCECKLCKSKELVMGLNDLNQGQNTHSFTKRVIVYFCGFASSWHPVISKLIGNVVLLSGLKKKLIFIGKEEFQLMYVTSEKTCLHMPRSPKRWLQYRKTCIEGKGECGVYNGIVKGVYMQGMVVELDEEVWLLLTDQLFTPPHSVRVGAIISLRNVHFVNAKFSGRRMLILGACFQTSIAVKSFSPLETGCHMVSNSQSLLGVFIESVAFSSRLWLLLVVSCFRKKFDGILSEKEILGSKHNEGLVQRFARSYLPSTVFRPRHGIFLEICKHDSCGCGSEPNYGHLNLVVPISYFVRHCEATWAKTLLQLEEERRIMGNNNLISFLFCRGKSYGRPIRRIYSSEDIGIDLLGSLKISPSSGRLQLIDATSSIDVVIPDLPSNWDVNSIYKVNDYSLVMEGIPEQLDHPGLLDSFSCRSIFNSSPSARVTNLAIYVHFQLRNATCKNFLFHPCMNLGDSFRELDSGTFHLLLITHKFPLLQKFQGDQVISNRSSMFVEAIVLPWDLFLSGKDGDTHPATLCVDELQKLMEHYGHVSCKKRKIDHVSSRALSSDFKDSFSHADNESCGHLSECSSPCRTCSKEEKHCNLSSSLKAPCLATIRSVNNHSLVSSGLLHYRQGNAAVGVDSKPSSQNVLLEFKYESLFKYQLLQIGGYYIIKHHEGDCLCNLKDSYYGAHPSSRLWSLSFSSDEHLAYNETSHDPPLVEPFSRNSEVLSLGSHQIEQLQRSASGCPEIHFDVDLRVSADILRILKVDPKLLEERLLRPAVTMEEVINASSCFGTMTNASVQPPAIAESGCLLPQGNLISLRGYVVEVHGLDCSSFDAHLTRESLCDHQFSFFQGVIYRVCIHLMLNHHTVRILGTQSKYAYPIGFGPGVNATFHRILQSGGQNDFMLTTVSHVVVNSIKVVNDQSIDKCSNLWSASNLSGVASLETVSAVLISELFRCVACNPVQLHCRVLAVHSLVLEKKDRKYDDPQSKSYNQRPAISIPLASFVMDDGSSLCCCWANAERAAALLRLHEEVPQNAFGSSCWKLKGIGVDKARRTSIHHVDKILKKHGRITVKNYGSLFDSSCQDLKFSISSDHAFNSSDENFLKFIILNSCFAKVWSVLGSVMNLDAVKQLETQLSASEMTMHSLQNVWVREVCYADPVAEARSVIQELLN